MALMASTASAAPVLPETIDKIVHIGGGLCADTAAPEKTFACGARKFDEQKHFEITSIARIGSECYRKINGAYFWVACPKT